MGTNVAASFHVQPSSTAVHPDTSQAYLRSTPDSTPQQQKPYTASMYPYQTTGTGTDFVASSSPCCSSSLLQSHRPVSHPAYDAGMSNLGEWGFGVSIPDIHTSQFNRPSAVNSFFLSPTSPQMNISAVNTMQHSSNGFTFSNCCYYGPTNSDNQWQM